MKNEPAKSVMLNLFQHLEAQTLKQVQGDDLLNLAVSDNYSFIILNS